MTLLFFTEVNTTWCKYLLPITSHHIIKTPEAGTTLFLNSYDLCSQNNDYSVAGLQKESVQLVNKSTAKIPLCSSSSLQSVLLENIDEETSKLQRALQILEVTVAAYWEDPMSPCQRMMWSQIWKQYERSPRGTVCGGSADPFSHFLRDFQQIFWPQHHLFLIKKTEFIIAFSMGLKIWHPFSFVS